MKIVRITPDRVRVFLSEGDLLDMHINSEDLSPKSPELGAFLGEILEAVKRETGFSPGDGRVLAEATPEARGIVLDLSHIPEGKEPVKEAVRPVRKDSMVFEFSGLENLTQMLKNISAHKLLNMRLYAERGKFFVAAPRRRAPAILYEYSLKNNKSPFAEYKIAEHGRLIAGGYRLVSIRDALKKIN